MIEKEPWIKLKKKMKKKMTKRKKKTTFPNEARVKPIIQN